jgi:uncharacterized protein (TIGR00251 family)
VLKATASGIEINVRVIPRASKTTLGPTRDDALIVRVMAPPVDNAANEALTDFFSELFGVPARAVRIVAGTHGRRKRIAIDGISAERARVILVG